MKKIILFCAAHIIYTSLYAMDLQPEYRRQTSNLDNKITTTTQSLESLIDCVDAAITMQGQKNPTILFTDMFLSGEEHNDIIKLISQHSPSPSNEFLAALYKKNIYFQNTIEHYISLAYKDIENVTCQTLEAIEHPELDQPTKTLNLLPLAIKKYVMQKAKENMSHYMNCSYTIELQHNKPVISVDVSDATGLAATVEKGADRITLWHLNKGAQCKQSLNCTGAKRLSINTDGSRVAAFCTDNNEYRIKEWNTETYNLTYNVKTLEKLKCIKYLKHSSKNVLLGIHAENSSTGIKLWMTDGDTPYYLGDAIFPCSQIGDFHTPRLLITNIYKIENYDPVIPFTTNNTIVVTKKNCHALKLCELAIASAQKRRLLQKIEASQSYQSLTEYEKDMVTKQMQEKRNALTTELKKKRSATTTETNPLLTTFNTLNTLMTGRSNDYTGSVTKL